MTQNSNDRDIVDQLSFNIPVFLLHKRGRSLCSEIVLSIVRRYLGPAFGTFRQEMHKLAYHPAQTVYHLVFRCNVL